MALATSVIYVSKFELGEHLMTDDRYQNQNFIVRAYRWLRWKPAYAILASYRVARWALRGCKPITWDTPDEDGWPVETRRSTLECIWGTTMGTASIRMKHYYTLEEVLGDLR